MASNLLAMASNLRAMASTLVEVPKSPFPPGEKRSSPQMVNLWRSLFTLRELVPLSFCAHALWAFFTRGTRFGGPTCSW